MSTMDLSEGAAIERRIRAKATRRVYARVGLVWHAVVFLIANAVMYAINERYSPAVAWFVWPLAGWSVGLALHALATFSSGGLTEEMILVQVERERKRSARPA